VIIEARQNIVEPGKEVGSLAAIKLLDLVPIQYLLFQEVKIVG